MDSYFREAFEGLHKASLEMQVAHGFIIAANQALVTANQAMVDASQAQQRAGDAMTSAMTAALHARDEHEDLRETVGRLEGTVLELVREVRELREGRQ